MISTLEQELKARTFLHKVAVVGGTLMHDYIEEEKAKKGAQIPDFILESQAQIYSDKIIQEAMLHGTFNKLYEDIWEKLKDIIPEHTKLIKNEEV